MTKKEIKECDKLWREVGLLKARNICEYPGCYKTEYLNAHHIYSRSRMSTRWDLNNCMILCSGHHTLNNESAHKCPRFIDVIIKAGIRSRKWFNDLTKKAYKPQKPVYEVIKLYLENEKEKYT